MFKYGQRIRVISPLPLSPCVGTEGVVLGARGDYVVCSFLLPFRLNDGTEEQYDEDRYDLKFALLPDEIEHANTP